MNKPVTTQRERILRHAIEQLEMEFPGEDITPVAIAIRLRHLSIVDQRALQDALEPFDIGAGEIDVLTHLAQQPPPHRLRPSDLAEFCMVTTGAITGRLGRLEQEGYIVRAPSTSDKRTIYVEMTEKGRVLIQQARDRVIETSRFMNGIRALPAAERERFNATLMKLIRILGE
ncbi:MarR family winged helix-turn-helix transcriptional regulator [Paraburkholderia bannensis]|uniref:MarR family winged helix-turn-helix transcriptional regulator n=1 Tax=Paraburkholderia bannensis TaxID=765414 RepID=UPI002ABE7B93|nr:MarR family transcriptional regulator [Paraburkholderia bannensis]